MAFQGNLFHTDISKVFREENYENCANLLDIIEAGSGSFEQNVFFNDFEEGLMSIARSSNISRQQVGLILESARSNFNLLYETFTRKEEYRF